MRTNRMTDHFADIGKMVRITSIGLALVGFIGLCGGDPVVAADRDTVAAQVAAQCSKDYPAPDYLTQLGCRKLHMDAFDELEKQDQRRADRPK